MHLFLNVIYTNRFVTLLILSFMKRRSSELHPIQYSAIIVQKIVISEITKKVTNDSDIYLVRVYGIITEIAATTKMFRITFLT